ncbi:hypothetical protein VTI74DRAFT_2884 [Chaetomium olivicolor]
MALSSRLDKSTESLKTSITMFPPSLNNKMPRAALSTDEAAYLDSPDQENASFSAVDCRGLLASKRTTTSYDTTISKGGRTILEAVGRVALSTAEAAYLDSPELENVFFAVVDSKGAATDKHTTSRDNRAPPKSNKAMPEGDKTAPKCDSIIPKDKKATYTEDNTIPKDTKTTLKADNTICRSSKATKRDKTARNEDEVAANTKLGLTPQLGQVDPNPATNSSSTVPVTPKTETPRNTQASKVEPRDKPFSFRNPQPYSERAVFTNNIWEAQRIYKGILDPYTYPEAHCQGPWNPNHPGVITDADWKPLPQDALGWITHGPPAWEEGEASRDSWCATSSAKKLVSPRNPPHRESAPTSHPFAPPKIPVCMPPCVDLKLKGVYEGSPAGTAAQHAGDAGVTDGKVEYSSKPTQGPGQTERKRFAPHRGCARKVPDLDLKPEVVLEGRSTGAATQPPIDAAVPNRKSVHSVKDAHGSGQTERKRPSPHKGSSRKAPHAGKPRLAAEGTNVGVSTQPSVQGFGQTNLDLRELSRHRMPRPNPNYANSLPSLPSSASSWENIGDTGVEIPGSDPGVPSTDIRNTIGLEHNIHRSDGIWRKYNWGNPWGRDDDDKFLDTSWYTVLTTAWMDQIPDAVVVKFEPDIGDHWKCDFDTATGAILPPISYPDTVYQPMVDKEMQWRRENWTSASLAERHHLGRPGRDRGRRRFRGYEDIQDLFEEDITIKVETPVYERPEYHPYAPRFPCHLRPAEKGDMSAVRDIYNHEVQRGVQALDTEPLSTEDFETILATCERLGMPFLVAVRGSAREKGFPTKGHFIRSTTKQYPFDNNPDAHPRGQIVGFAYLSVYQLGLAGSATGTSRASARMHLYVHPDCRRKNVGCSLMDMMLTAVSKCFVSEQAYDFVDAHDREAYHKAKHAKRQFYKLYLSFFVRHKAPTLGDRKLEEDQKGYDDDLVWVRNLLVERFGFDELGRFEAAHRSPKRGEGKEVVWLDEVVFEHKCGFDPRWECEGY